jgi:hypothetical protein
MHVQWYAWIRLDHPRREDVVGYLHLALVWCLLAEGAGLGLAEGIWLSYGHFFPWRALSEAARGPNDLLWGAGGAEAAGLAAQTRFCTLTSNRRFVCPGVVLHTSYMLRSVISIPNINPARTYDHGSRPQLDRTWPYTATITPPFQLVLSNHWELCVHTSPKWGPWTIH